MINQEEIFVINHRSWGKLLGPSRMLAEARTSGIPH